MMDDIKLRDLADGTIRFSITAEDNTDNDKTHKDFRQWCKGYTKNDYTIGLRVLLDYYHSNGYFELLWEQLKNLETRITELEAQELPEKETNNGCF